MDLVTPVMDLITPDWRVKARLSTDSDFEKGEVKILTRDEAVAYLNASPRNALILISAEDNTIGRVEFNPNLYIVRGASEELDNFYYGDMPAEDPNDANGGSLSAIEAIADATAPYYE